MLDRFHKLAILALITSTAYLIWLFFSKNSGIGNLFFVLEFLVFLLLLLLIINHWTRRYELFGGSYSLQSKVDIFIPTRGEPLKMLERTVSAACEIEYPNKKVYILDDGARSEVVRLASKYNCVYFRRSDLYKKKYKAANLNWAFRRTSGDFILVLDADQVCRPTILKDLLGHFKDPKVALVSTRQRFNVSKEDFNNDNLFFEYMQPGKNVDGVAISCGSGVIYRRKALVKIGGFQEWNIVEDVYTTYVLNLHGYKSVYVNQAYAIGEAPQDIKTIYKQRGLWARDTLRLFFWKAPFLNRKLNWRKKLHYFEMGYCYIICALVLPAIFILNIYSTFTNIPILETGVSYFFFKLPSFFLVLYMVNSLGQGSQSTRMWFSLFPLFFKNMFLALIYKKPSYKVTNKINGKKGWYLIFPQTLLVLMSIFSCLWHFEHWEINWLLSSNFFWHGVLIYMVWPLFLKAFDSAGNFDIRKTLPNLATLCLKRS